MKTNVSHIELIALKPPKVTSWLYILLSICNRFNKASQIGSICYFRENVCGNIATDKSIICCTDSDMFNLSDRIVISGSNGSS